LAIYRRPYDPKRPVVCRDEQPKPLIAETCTPLSLAAGRPPRVDYEYIRAGVCTVWMFVEPLAGWRTVPVTARKTAVDWAEQVQPVVDDPRYAEAERITLVCDNLNTHDLASFYHAFTPQEALRLVRKLDLVHTPKHGSWLNMAEPELSVLSRQCLNRRIAEEDTVAQEARQWAADRNATQVAIDWQFRTEDARIKLKHLYPKIKM